MNRIQQGARKSSGSAPTSSCTVGRNSQPETLFAIAGPLLSWCAKSEKQAHNRLKRPLYLWFGHKFSRSYFYSVLENTSNNLQLRQNSCSGDRRYPPGRNYFTFCATLPLQMREDEEKHLRSPLNDYFGERIGHRFSYTLWLTTPMRELFDYEARERKGKAGEKTHQETSSIMASKLIPFKHPMDRQRTARHNMNQVFHSLLIIRRKKKDRQVLFVNISLPPPSPLSSNPLSLSTRYRHIFWPSTFIYSIFSPLQITKV